jgi:hypothetical protein
MIQPPQLQRISNSTHTTHTVVPGEMEYSRIFSCSLCCVSVDVLLPLFRTKAKPGLLAFLARARASCGLSYMGHVFGLQEHGFF